MSHSPFACEHARVERHFHSVEVELLPDGTHLLRNIDHLVVDGKQVHALEARARAMAARARPLVLIVRQVATAAAVPTPTTSPIEVFLCELRELVQELRPDTHVRVRPPLVSLS